MPPSSEEDPAPRLSAMAQVRRAARVVGASLKLVGNALENTGRLLGDAGQDTQQLVTQLGELGLSLSETVPELLRQIQATPRLARVVREVLRVVASYRLQRARSELLGTVALPDELDALHRANAERIYRLCVEQRGALIKVGQLASSRVDLLPPAWVEVLSRLQDQVPAVPSEAILASIESELGGTLDTHFAEVETEPLATASIAQVHAARLLDGTEVVIKVRVPGIVALVEADLRALSLLARVLNDRFPELGLVTIADELGRSVREELDFEREAENAERLAADLSDVPGVIVPSVVRSHSTGAVLTLTRLRGERLVSFLEGCERDGDEVARDALFEILLRSFFVQVLEGGAFQADPHPGNFLVLPGPRLGLLDFGCVMYFEGAARQAYASLLMALLGRDVRGMAELLAKLGFRGRSGAEDADEIEPFVERLLDLFHTDLTSSLAGLDVVDQIAKAMALVREQSMLRAPQDFVLLARVFAALSGLVIRFGPNLKLTELAWPSLTSALQAP